MATQCSQHSTRPHCCEKLLTGWATGATDDNGDEGQWGDDEHRDNTDRSNVKDHWSIPFCHCSQGGQGCKWTGCEQQQKRGPDNEDPSTHLHHCKQLLAGRIGGC